MKRSGWLMLALVVFFAGLLLSSCITETGWWKPGTDFDEAITSEEFIELPSEEQKEFVGVEWKAFSPPAITTIEEGAATTEAVYEIIRPMIPEPLATGGTLALGAIATLLTYLSRKKIVTKLIETGQGVQDYRDGKQKSLTVSLEAAQSDETKKYIAGLKSAGKIIKTKAVITSEEESGQAMG